MGFGRPLVWIAALAAIWAADARIEGRLTPRPDPMWYAARRRMHHVIGTLVAPAKRSRAGWRSILEFASPTGVQRAQLWLPHDAKAEDFSPGAYVDAEGKLAPPRMARDPGDDDEAARLTALRCAWVFRARDIRVLSPPPARWILFGWAQRRRLQAEDSFAQVLEPRRAGLLSALMFGDSGSLSRDVSRALRDSGGAHLLVVSGLKVGFVAAAAAAVFLTLGFGVAARIVAASLAAGFYALMAGFDPPAARAWIMISCAAASRLSDWPTTPSATLTIAAILLIANDPASATSPGALMSFGGTAAVLAAVEHLEKAAPASWPRFLRAFFILAGINLAIAVALWPLYAGVFGRGSLIGPAANVALVPVAAVLLAGGAALCAAPLLPTLFTFYLARGVDLGLNFFERIAQRAAAVPNATISLRPWTACEIAAYALGLSALLALKRPRFAALLMSAAFLVWGAPKILRPPAPVSVVLLSRSNAALLRFNGGPALFIGRGEPDAAARRAAVVLGAPIARTARGPLRLRLGRDEISLGNPAGDGVLCGANAFDIITVPRAKALEASTDGDTLQVREFKGTQFCAGAHFLRDGGVSGRRKNFPGAHGAPARARRRGARLAEKNGVRSAGSAHARDRARRGRNDFARRAGRGAAWDSPFGNQQRRLRIFIGNRGVGAPAPDRLRARGQIHRRTPLDAPRGGFS